MNQSGINTMLLLLRRTLVLH